MAKKGYVDLRGRVRGTPYGIAVEVFINDELLDKCQVFRESFVKQKATVPNQDAAAIQDKRIGVKFVQDPTKE